MRWTYEISLESKRERAIILDHIATFSYPSCLPTRTPTSIRCILNTKHKTTNIPTITPQHVVLRTLMPKHLIPVWKDEISIYYRASTRSHVTDCTGSPVGFFCPALPSWCADINFFIDEQLLQSTVRSDDYFPSYNGKQFGLLCWGMPALCRAKVAWRERIGEG